MYLDAKGYVTVGVGHLLEDLPQAQRLRFQTGSGSPASADEIRLDYETIRAQPPNRIAAFYRRHAALTLPACEIDRLTDVHIDAFHHALRALYPHFDTFPSAARLALFDLIFNLGQTNLRGAWPSMNAAIRAGDWAAAATHSRRAAPVSAERNRYVKELFEQAARR